MNVDDETNDIGTQYDDEVSDIGTEEPKPKSPALTINIQSWVTPVVGLLMLVIGLAAGYFLRPMLTPAEAEAPPPLAAAPTAATTSQPDSAAQTTEQPANLQELMDYLLPQIKHFQGDEQAAVTIIEFSDFQ